MEAYELQSRIQRSEAELVDLQAEIHRLRQKQEVYGQHMEKLRRQEEAGEEFYFQQRRKLEPVRCIVRGRATESAVCEYDELLGNKRWEKARDDFEEIRIIIQRNINLAEEKIQNAEKRIYALEEQISTYQGELRRMETEATVYRGQLQKTVFSGKGTKRHGK